MSGFGAIGFWVAVGFGAVGFWVAVGFGADGFWGAVGFGTAVTVGGVAVGLKTGFFLFFTVTLQTSFLFFIFAVTFTFPVFLAVTFPRLLTTAVFLSVDFHFTFLELVPRIFKVKLFPGRSVSFFRFSLGEAASESAGVARRVSSERERTPVKSFVFFEYLMYTHSFHILCNMLQPLGCGCKYNTKYYKSVTK